MVEVFVVLFFLIYIFLESLSVIPRFSGLLLGRNSIGYSFSNICNTLKRVFVVLYPPLLGWMSMNGEDILMVIYFSYFSSFFAIAFIFYTRGWFLNFFSECINEFNSNGNSIKSILFVLRKTDKIKSNKSFDKKIKFDKKIVFLAAWVYLIYTSSLFIVNIVGDKFIGQAPLIYQLIGVINALGTIVFAFLLDPKISKTVDEGGDFVLMHNSLLLGALINLCFLGPLLVLVVSKGVSIF